MSNREMVEVEATFCHSTASQWFVRNERNVTVSLPRSQVELPSFTEEPVSGTTVTLQVPAWLVEEKGLNAK